MRVFASISLAFGLMASTAALAAERTIIVLDASGSMWGQIDGTAKISIAREALGGVVADLDPAREVGLMAYGHRQKGQCSDIELMVEPQANFADRILDTVAGVKPKGKTPLSDAVRQAAEALKYTEDKATVILITDGLETCNADPCALGKALEESGVDFTAHVVGFGLTDAESREVACLAEETGGLYLSAADGTELVEALDQTVVAETQPAPAQQEEEPEPVPEATLTAPDEAEIAAVVDVVWEGPGEKYDRIEIFDPNSGPDGKAVRRISLNGPGYDQNTVAMTLPATEGDYVLRYFSGTHRQVIGTRPISVVPVDVALFAPETISMGKTLNVEWIGPGAKYDAVVIFDPNAGPNGKKVRDGRLQNSTFDDKLVSMPAPAKPGMYELQYFSGQDRKVLATRMIEVTEAVVQMTAEEPMSAGKPIIVDWIGPGAKYDSILLWDPNAGPDGKKLKDVRLSSGDYANQRVTISGPAKAGSYELRYYNGDNRAVLATEIIEVAETVVSLTPEGALETGKNFKVAWEGPGARYDEVRLFDPNSGPDGKRIQSKRLNAGDYDNQTVTLPGPPKPGTYELRYYNGDNRVILVSVPVEFTETPVGLDAPETVQAASKIKIAWEGPGARRDEIVLWDVTTDKKVTSKRLTSDDYDNRSLTLSAPAKTGDYELRYFNVDNRSVLASRPLTVVPTIVSLTAPSTIGQAKALTIVWQGPGDRRDEVQILAPGSDRPVQSKRLISDDYDNNRITLPAPAAVGPYTVRYWNTDNRTAMTEITVEVTPVPTSLSGPDAVEPKTRFAVTWEGPGARRDQVQIVKAGETRVLLSTRLVNGDYAGRSVDIRAPNDPGDYMLQYFNTDNRTVLFEMPLSVN